MEEEEVDEAEHVEVVEEAEIVAEEEEVEEEELEEEEVEEEPPPLLQPLGADVGAVVVCGGGTPLLTALGPGRKERSKSETEKVCFAQALPRLESRICSNSEALG